MARFRDTANQARSPPRSCVLILVHALCSSPTIVLRGRFGRRLFLRQTLRGRGTSLCHSQSLPQALQGVAQAFQFETSSLDIKTCGKV
jgi:hypothetical protein